MQIPTQAIISEMKDRPTTMVTLLVLCAFAVWGYMTFAYASDIDTIRTEVKTQITSVSIAVTANAANISKVLKLQLAEAIRGQRRQFCGSEDDRYRESVQSLIDQLQEDYKELNGGVAYPLGTCR